METDTPAAPIEQPKTIQEKIQEAKETKTQLWNVFLRAQEAARPFHEKEDAARAAFCTALERLKLLETIEKEIGR